MIDRIIAWSLGNRLLVLVLAAGLLAWGGWSASRAPVDVFPDLTAPTVTVVTEAHGMPPEDVEIQVTLPIETALNGAANVRRVRSSSGIGISVVTIEFDWGTDIYRARQVVAEKLQVARSSLPTGLAPPVLTPITSIMGEVMFIALKSGVHSEMELKTAADWVVRRRLLAVPGVAEVIPIGGRTRQFQVIVQPERLATFDVSLAEVLEAVREAGRNASAGFLVENGQEFLIQGIGRVRGLADIEQAVVATRNDMPVLVRDLALVEIGPAPRRGTGAHNDEPAVVLGIQKQPGVNTLGLTDRRIQPFGQSQRIDAGTDRTAGYDDRRNPGVTARRHADRDRRVPSGRFHPDCGRQPECCAARRRAAGRRDHVRIPVVGARHRHCVAGDSVIAADRRADNPRAGRRCDHRGREHRAPASGKPGSGRGRAPPGLYDCLRGHARDRGLDRIRDADHHPCVPAAVLPGRRRRPSARTAGPGLHRLAGRVAAGRADHHAGTVSADAARAARYRSRPRQPDHDAAQAWLSART